MQHKLPATALSIDGVQVSPITSVRHLGIFIDSDLVIRSHVQRTVSGCFAALRQLRQIRNSVPTATFQSLVVAPVLSRLEYGNSVLVGLPLNLVRRLQSVQNVAARLICRRRRFNHDSNRCAGQLGERRLQDRRANVQGYAWDRT